MLEFITRYWVEVAFGLIIAGITWLFKRHLKLEKEHADADREKNKQEILNITREENQEQINRIQLLESELTALKAGLLSVQGRMYREFCEQLLAEYDEIPIELFEQEEEDYATYKQLGGNHRGDSLHNAVVKKFNTQVSK